MPPLPTVFDPSILSAIQQLDRRLKDLEDFQLPRLRKCDDSLAVQQRYAAEIRDDLDALASQLETLDARVLEQATERDRRALESQLSEFKASLARLRKDVRGALLASKRAIDARATSNRDELLRSTARRDQTGDSAADDALMKATNDVTEALRRTVGLMQGELEKSVLSSQMLEQSSASLRATADQHSSLSLVLGTSKQLLAALERADTLDRLLLLAALLFFFCVVLFILKQRILDRGVRVAFFWTRFIPGLPKSGGGAWSALVPGGDDETNWDRVQSSVTPTHSLIQTLGIDKAALRTMTSGAAAGTTIASAFTSGVGNAINSPGTTSAAVAQDTASSYDPQLQSAITAAGMHDQRTNIMARDEL